MVHACSATYARARLPPAQAVKPVNTAQVSDRMNNPVVKWDGAEIRQLSEEC